MFKQRKIGGRHEENGNNPDYGGTLEPDGTPCERTVQQRNDSWGREEGTLMADPCRHGKARRPSHPERRIQKTGYSTSGQPPAPHWRLGLSPRIHEILLRRQDPADPRYSG